MIQRRRIQTILMLIVLATVFLCVGSSAAHPLDQETTTLKVAIKQFPPFVMKNGDSYTGFSIDLWDAIAKELGVAYQFDEVQKVTDQLAAVQNGDADAAIAGITITEDREKTVDFTYPYFDSGLQIMVLAQESAPLENTLKVLLAPSFLEYVAIFAVLIIVTAHIFWLFERRHPEFPQGYRAGIAALLWWSTLTVLGYDDRSPATRPGRIITVMWMFAGVFLIANLVAILSAGATVRELRSSIRSISDLQGQRVATVDGTTSASYLRANGIPFTAVTVITDAYTLLLNRQVDAVLYDSPVLRYYISTSGNPDLQIVGPIVDTEKYGIALPSGSKYRKLINEATLRLQENGTYQQIYQRWFGAGSN